MLRVSAFASLGVHAAFSDASDGGVRDEHDPLAEQMVWRAGYHLPLYQCKQAHGDAVWWVEWGPPPPDGADILLSRQRNCTLAIRTADCLPVLLVDGCAGVVAAVHAGWRGSAKAVVATAVTAMVEIGAKTADIHAALGPAIGMCCFAIGDHCRQLLQAADGVGLVEKDGNWRADLVAINRYQLQQAGVDDGHITEINRCTCCSPGFFSHRRDHSPWRQLAAIGLT